MADRPLYLDFAATTPVDPEVAEVFMFYMTEEFGNAGIRTHVYGSAAKAAVARARRRVARHLDAKPSEVVFTSGATESNNLAILGLRDYGIETGRKHLVTTKIEHKSVLEPVAALEREGFEVTYICPGPSGRIEADDVASAVRRDTLLVSVMHANNETGVIQPIRDIGSLLRQSSAFFHVDAAQAFGKIEDVSDYLNVDLLSFSAHKIYGPKGVGGLVGRPTKKVFSALKPIMHGGGQEKGLRPGTTAVPLVAGLDKAIENLENRHTEWLAKTRKIDRHVCAFASKSGLELVGESEPRIPVIATLILPGIDAEAAFVVLRSAASISNGSACTSSSHDPSHVLQAMGMSLEAISCSIRVSWGDKSFHSQITESLQNILSLTQEA